MDVETKASSVHLPIEEFAGPRGLPSILKHFLPKPHTKLPIQEFAGPRGLPSVLKHFLPTNIVHATVPNVSPAAVPNVSLAAAVPTILNTTTSTPAVSSTKSQLISQIISQQLPKKKPSAPVQRTEDYSFNSVSGRFSRIKGKSFLNPKQHEQIPKLHDRKATYAKYAKKKKLLFYFTNPEPLVDDIYLTGVCPNGATISLKLLNLLPFFFMSTPPDLEFQQPSEENVEYLLNYLNQRRFWPKYFDGSNHSLPILSIDTEARKCSAGYSGVDPLTGKRRTVWQYKLNFKNMSCWRHYRTLITPLREHERETEPHKYGDKSILNKAYLQWQPRMNHERNFFTYIQMLFNSNPIAPKTWLQIDGRQCKWKPLDAPDSFGGYSDVGWNEDDLERQESEAKRDFKQFEELKRKWDQKTYGSDSESSASDVGESSSESEKDIDNDVKKRDNDVKKRDESASDNDSDDSSSGDDHGTKKRKHSMTEEELEKLQRKKKRKLKKQEKRKETARQKFHRQKTKLSSPKHQRHSRCVLEGEIDYRQLIRRPDVVGGGPVCQAYFDIETASGK